MVGQQHKSLLPISLAELRRRVIQHDSSLISQGFAPYQRPLLVSVAIARELGITCTIGAFGSDPVTTAVQKIYQELYSKRDLAMPPVHDGAIMFRDVFFRVRVPIVYGTVAINPFDFIDEMSDAQKQWMASEPTALGRFFDQFIDLWDFGYGLENFSRRHAGDDEVVSLFCLGRAYLEAAANACVGSVDPYAVVQNSLIAIELLLKGALRSAGCTEKKLKATGHDLVALSAEFASRHPAADGGLMGRVCASLPRLVTHRYQRLNLSRVQIGDVVMKAQYLGGEIMRQLSDRSFRQAVGVGDIPPPVPRTFPG